MSGTGEAVLVGVSTLVGFAFAYYQYQRVSQIEVNPESESHALVAKQEGISDESMEKMFLIHNHIKDGAKAFLAAEYRICALFVLAFGTGVLFLTSKVPNGWNWTAGAFTALSYVLGAATSMMSGYVGMMVAVHSNVRTTHGALRSWTVCFDTALSAGVVAGFFLVSLGVLVLFLLVRLLSTHFDFVDAKLVIDERQHVAETLFEAVAGFGLGASTVALFGRVGGGIYTKAADVGADLAGKVIENLPEDDPRNPATIADNVGDNVGDVAGMGADLFGSFAEATCAAFVVSTTSLELVGQGWGTMLFPLTITGTGILVCIVTTMVATTAFPVTKEADIETSLKIQLGLSAFLMTIASYALSKSVLPESFILNSSGEQEGFEVTNTGAFLCIACGLWGGCFIGFVTEYYTSHSYGPVREVADACHTGAATNLIYGLSLGYKSTIIPVITIAINVYVSFYIAGMYGVALAALGMLGTLPTCLAIDVYGPVCDNAGGIAEMAELPEEVREKTDALDAAGNTTAAIGKGFAIGSAALVSLALFGAFVTRIGQQSVGVNILKPVAFAALFVGAMLPYWFTAMTMKSVGTAAKEMVEEVERQFHEIKGLLEGAPGHDPPDHARCIKISTDSSLREMLPPGLLVILSPVVVGTLFGVQAVSGLLVGALVSGVQLAISQSNSGGAWDNAKKYIEKGAVTEMRDGEEVVLGKGTEFHKAAVVGDTVGDPLKDTSGPALNILMKLMAIISLVFADFFMSINEGRGVFDMAP